MLVLRGGLVWLKCEKVRPAVFGKRHFSIILYLYLIPTIVGWPFLTQLLTFHLVKCPPALESLSLQIHPSFFLHLILSLMHLHAYACWYWQHPHDMTLCSPDPNADTIPWPWHHSTSHIVAFMLRECNMNATSLQLQLLSNFPESESLKQTQTLTLLRIRKYGSSLFAILMLLLSCHTHDHC